MSGPRPLRQESRLWRYVGFTKFVALLHERALYFARADHFDDAFEGAKGIAEREPDYDLFYRKFLREALLTAPGRDVVAQGDEWVEREAKRLLADLRSVGQRDREQTFISCWHEAEHESEAMWRLYAGWKFVEGGLAIGSRVSRLKASLPPDEVRVGRVEYVDFGTALVGVNDAFWRKDLSFQHEQEVRAIIVRPAIPAPAGLSIPVDLSILIEEVRLSPEAPSWFESMVRGVVERFGCRFKVRRSTLERTPFY